MKKKLLSLLLVFTLAWACALPAFATDLSDSTSSSDFTLNQTMIGVKPGETYQLSANLYGASPAPAVWTSSDSTIATVGGDGLVTGVNFGIATITATNNGLSVSCTVHVALNGIDVSHHQTDNGAIDWNQVKASGVDFALVKATEGVDYVDPSFADSMTGAAAAGLHVGAYHFLRAGDAQEQARQFLAAVKPYYTDYPLAVDVEHNELTSLGKSGLTDMIVTFCEAVRAAGFRPMVYTNLNWARNYIDMSRLTSYDLWFARYNHTPGYDGVSVWQYSSTVSVPGINGSVDGNYSYKSFGTLRSDTVVPYTFGSNSTYTYKITTKLASAPIATSTNPDAVTVSFYKKVSDGYLYQIQNVNEGTALITTTGSDGTSTSFVATGRLKGIVSDTTGSFTMQQGGVYQLKLTLVGGATGTPVVSTGNGAVLGVLSSVKSGDSFYVKIKAYGAGETGLYTTMPGQKAIRQSIVTVAGSPAPVPPTPTQPSTPAQPSVPTQPSTPAQPSGASVTSDTTVSFTMQRSGVYQFKFTVSGTSAVPAFTTGNGSVLKVISSAKSGSSYFVKVQAGQSGCTAVYTTLPGQSAVRHCVVNVA